MDTEEPLYILISPNNYRANKSNILMSQADLLGTLKKLYSLKVLARQKQDLKKRLYKLFTQILSDINSIQDKMPTPKMPKITRKEEVVKTAIKKDFSKYRDIEDELRLIQEKLRELNG